MKLLRSAFSVSIAGAVLAIVGSPTASTAQDPKNPQLPEHSEAPASTGPRGGDSDHAKLLEARREIEVLEAKIAVRKAEIEGIMASVRLRQAREKLSTVVADAYKYRLMMDDMTRESVPFPDSYTGPQIPVDQQRQIKKAVLDAVDAKNRPLLDALNKKVIMAFPDKTPLEDVLKYLRTATKGDKLPNGIPITVDPVGMPDAELTMRMMVTIKTDDLPLKNSLKLVLRQVGLTYAVKDGLLVISSPERDVPK